MNCAATNELTRLDELALDSEVSERELKGCFWDRWLEKEKEMGSKGSQMAFKDSSQRSDKECGASGSPTSTVSPWSTACILQHVY